METQAQIAPSAANGTTPTNPRPPVHSSVRNSVSRLIAPTSPILSLPAALIDPGAGGTKRLIISSREGADAPSVVVYAGDVPSVCFFLTRTAAEKTVSHGGERRAVSGTVVARRVAGAVEVCQHGIAIAIRRAGCSVEITGSGSIPVDLLFRQDGKAADQVDQPKKGGAR